MVVKLELIEHREVIDHIDLAVGRRQVKLARVVPLLAESGLSLLLHIVGEGKERHRLHRHVSILHATTDAALLRLGIELIVPLLSAVVDKEAELADVVVPLVPDLTGTSLGVHILRILLQQLGHLLLLLLRLATGGGIVHHLRGEVIVLFCLKGLPQTHIGSGALGKGRDKGRIAGNDLGEVGLGESVAAELIGD